VSEHRSGMPSSVAANNRLPTEHTRVSHALLVASIDNLSFVITRDILAIHVLLSRQDHLLRWRAALPPKSWRQGG